MIRKSRGRVEVIGELCDPFVVSSEYTRSTALEFWIRNRRIKEIATSVQQAVETIKTTPKRMRCLTMAEMSLTTE